LDCGAFRSCDISKCPSGLTLDIDEYREAFMIEFGETGENSGVR